MDDAKNFVLGLMQTARERFGNPFISAFAIAWVLWNFRLVLILVGGGTAEQKIAHIDKKLFPDWWDWAIHCYLIPTCVALAWIYLFPLILRRIAVDHERNVARTRDAIFTAIDTRTLSAEEALHLRQVMVKQRAEWQTEKAETVQSLENFEKRTADLAGSLKATQEHNKKLEEELASLKAPPPRKPFDFYQRSTAEKAGAIGLELTTFPIEQSARVLFDGQQVAWPWAPTEFQLFNVKSGNLVRYPVDQESMLAMLYIASVCAGGAQTPAAGWQDVMANAGVRNPAEVVRHLKARCVLVGRDEKLSFATQTVAEISWFKSIGFAMVDRPQNNAPS